MKNKVFYIVLSLSFILILNLFFNPGIRERIFFARERVIDFTNLTFQIPGNWPLPSSLGNNEKGQIIFFKEYHPQKYNWYLVICWNKANFDWKALLPPLKKDTPATVEPEYIFREAYPKSIKFQNRPLTYQEITLWIKRPCGNEERNWLFLFETQLKKKFFKVLLLSDNKAEEKIFRRLISRLNIKD